MIDKALALAQKGDFTALAALTKSVELDDGSTALRLGSILKSAGLFSQAHSIFKSVAANHPQLEWQALANLASIFASQGFHQRAFETYKTLVEREPNSKSLRRNLLLTSQYHPSLSEQQRYALALEWGAWVNSALGHRVRPQSYDHDHLRIGYVSAEMCQHTVGLLSKDVLTGHKQFAAYVYSDSPQSDWVSNHIKQKTHFRDVRSLSDSDLATLIRQDEIDILVDLSGHTAGSRLTTFALRSAPIQIAWLGYFATTGLECIDAVLLDEYHAPESMQQYFVEPICRLPSRFFYKPVPWAGEVSEAPCLKNGYITFGCFNNTAKFNKTVFDAWAEILKQVSDSKLVLKWQSFNDKEYCESVFAELEQRGIHADRLELRPPSFHKDVLKQYADIDIGLDPFPFTGGLTSLEALWMGVPVITHPMASVVSRQTLSVLSLIGLEDELVGETTEAYVQQAVTLANHPQRIAELRSQLRERMRQSELMDLKRYMESFERAVKGVYHAVLEARNNAKSCVS